MKRWAVLVVVAMMATVGWAADANGVNEVTSWWDSVKFAAWPMMSEDSDVTELRVGVEYSQVGIYAAPRYDVDLVQDEEVLTDIRVYGVLSAIKAETVSNFLGTDIDLPDGELYANIFAGFELIDNGQMEAGWGLGGKADIAVGDTYCVYGCVEYQYLIRTWRDEEDRYCLMYGIQGVIWF